MEEMIQKSCRDRDEGVGWGEEWKGGWGEYEKQWHKIGRSNCQTRKVEGRE